MALNASALITVDFFNTLWVGSALSDALIELYINAVSVAFETICNRKLKYRSYTYVAAEEDALSGIYYDEAYTILDPPVDDILWMPTYPVTAISSFIITDTTITEQTDNESDSGYVLYKKNGKVVYSGGWDSGYFQNIKIKWSGGYSDTSLEMDELKFLCYSCVKDNINKNISNTNSDVVFERIGDYQYKLGENTGSSSNQQMIMVSPSIMNNLTAKYRREAIG